MTYRLYFDGSCEPVNPGGVAAYGWVITREISGITMQISQGYGIVAKGKRATNNLAEYAALCFGLSDFWQEETGSSLIVLGDSQLVINQVAGKWKCKAVHLRPWWNLATKTADLIGDVRFEWIPREENYLADNLSRQAYLMTK
jgi:ribonuclease HI